MERPSLRHFKNEGIFHIKSDPVEALHDGAWIPAVYTDKGWATADGSRLLSEIVDWHYADKKEQKGNEVKQDAKARSQKRIRKARKIQEAEG
jgi:hypothetical protein